ncbi:MAG: glycosyltransferase family 9 protein, partial [Deltaproteobacteria bacterium]
YKFEEVARWALDSGYLVCLVGGADSVESGAGLAARFDPKRVINLTGKTSLAETAAVLSLSVACVSSDTGVLHIGYAVGAKVVGLFGSAIKEKWAPRGTKSHILTAELECSPCTKGSITPSCKNGFKCMDDISADSVINALEELLG